MPALELDKAFRAQRRERAKERRRWLVRAVVLLNLALIGSVAVRGRPASAYYYAARGDAAMSLAKGLGVGLVVFLIVATIGYAVKRAGIYARWSEVAFGKPVLIVTFVLLVFGAGARVARHQEAVLNATPNVQGSGIQRERAQQDARDWSDEFAPIGPQLKAGIRDVQTAGSLLKHGNNAHARAVNRDARRHFAAALAAVRAVPDYPEADLNAARDALARQLALQTRAADLYIAALEDNLRRGVPLATDRPALAKLTHGDRLLKSAGKRIVRVVDGVSERYSLPEP